MDAFTATWTAIGPVEGGYSNNPADPGGETMWGITARLARANGYTGLMVDMPRDIAASIARSEFWAKLHLDSVSDVSRALAAEMFDIDFNMGPHAARWIQECLNGLNRRGKDWPDLTIDGVFGTTSISALNQLKAMRGDEGMTVLLRLLVALRGVEYLRDVEARPISEDFLYGWVRARVLMDGPSLPA